jgi:RNA polymerase-binding transcription factor DksA
MNGDPVIPRLIAQREAALERIAAMSAELERLDAAAAGSNADDEHDPEGATLAFERQQVAAARDAARGHVADLDAALDRAAGGDYGSCERCGQDIGAERLAALPATRMCVSCAAGARSTRSPGRRL